MGVAGASPPKGTFCEHQRCIAKATLTIAHSQGWTWQESAHSARVLNFAPSELVWECRQEVIAECGYEPPELPSLGLARKFHRVEQQPFDHWRELVQSYSGRNLTDFNDILPAIVGLAIRVQEATNWKYYAGIWGHELPINLLWEVTRSVDRQGDPLPKVPHPEDFSTGAPKPCRTPSWSWASIQSKVRTSDTAMGFTKKYSGRDGHTTVDRSFAAMNIDVRYHKVEDMFPADPDIPLGEVTGGRLIVQGRLIPATLTHEKDTRKGFEKIERWYYFLNFDKDSGEKGRKIQFSPDTELEPFLRPDEPSQNLSQSARRCNVEWAEFSAEVHCLLIAECPGVSGDLATCDGLVLGRSDDNWDYFKRIGYFCFPNSSHFRGLGYQKVTIA